MMLLLLLVGAVWASPAHLCETEFEFASYYASNMVLQRAPSAAVVWGYAADVGDTVSLTISGEEYTTTANIGPTGRPEWSITIAAREASDVPVTITAMSVTCTISLENVIFGDVYVCSGQSNMAHTLQNIDDSQPDIEDVVNYPNVRTFFTGLEYSAEPQFDLISVRRTWELPTEANMSPYSAVCWLFGKHLYEKYGRPIGLIQAAWGGTRIEAWSSPDALDVCFPDGVNPGEGQNSVSGLYNAMIHPFLPMPIYGAIWYQGEANANAHADYGCAVSEMVNDWRAKWSESTGGETNPSFPAGTRCLEYV